MSVNFVSECSLSISITKIPDSLPVATPMFNSGQVANHSLILVGSEEARSPQFNERGCFPGDVQPGLPQLQPLPSSAGTWRGTIRKPIPAYSRDAFSRSAAILLTESPVASSGLCEWLNTARQQERARTCRCV